MTERRYAEDTKVPVSRSQTELQSLLQKHGATNYVSGVINGYIALMFEMHDRRIRFTVPLPVGREGRYSAEQITRSRWRALVLIVRAKMESVATGIVTFDDEWLAHTVMPNGETVGEWAQPQLRQVAAGGKMPPMLPGIATDNVIALDEGKR